MQINRLFLSHSWDDKPLARRVARGLNMRGLDVWIDEKRLRLGHVLDTRLRAEIEASDAFAVLLTSRAIGRAYVALEIEAALARDPRPIILPLVAERGIDDPRLGRYLHADITDPYEFEDRMDEIAEALGVTPQPPERALLLEIIDDIERRHPDLASLAVSLRDDRELGSSLAASLQVSHEDRHALEELLRVAMALHGDDQDSFDRLARGTAAIYLRTRLGLPILRSALTRLSDTHNTILSSIAEAHLDTDHLAQSLRLFRDMGAPDDHAFARFVRENFGMMTETQRRKAIEYICVPKRGPGGFAMDVAFALFERMPESEALHRLWYFWINDDKIWTDVPFSQFASWMALARERKLTQFEPLIDYVAQCFRWTGRPKDLEDLDRAVERLRSARRSTYPDVAGLERQMRNGLGAAETDWLTRHRLHEDYRSFVHASPDDDRYLGFELSHLILDALSR